MNAYGFIIIRHVNSTNTNKYWNQSVKLLNALYPSAKIVIIDDNSNKDFIKPDREYNNIQIVESEFSGRGELLPYYYYTKNKYFNNAIILHDSVFIHKRINFEVLHNCEVLPLWYFNPDRENVINTLQISEILNGFYTISKKLTLNDDTILGMPQTKWYGCFGSMTYINHDFLLKVNNKYNLTNLVKTIKNRKDRCCLERIIGCIFFTECPKLCKKKAIFGDIMKYQTWGYSFDNYINDLQKGTLPKSIIKV